MISRQVEYRQEMRTKGSAMEFNELSDEQKAKAQACKTPEDVLALAKEEGYELSDDELEAISGGWGCNEQNFNCGMVGR